MIDSRDISRLKAAQAAFVSEALNRPQEKNAFEYGFRCGVNEGYNLALKELLKLNEEEMKSDDKL